MMTDLDILICIVPKVNPDAPTVGPSLLKANLLNVGFTCEVLDLNIMLFNELKKHGDESFYYKKDYIFQSITVEPDEPSEFNSFYQKYEYVFLGWLDLIKNKNPKYLGLSLLSFYSRTVSKRLCKLVKANLPDVKIVWGGADVNVEEMQPLKDIGLIDHYITGDGELAITELLKGNLDAPGIDLNGRTQILDLNDVLPPNYDDIDWDAYVKKEKQLVYITGSRGCVKNCTFCDVPYLWPKYVFRNADNVMEEIKHVRSKYNRKHFEFTDSLVNGNLKVFKTLLQKLKEYREEGNDITWSSQWIIRSAKQSPEEDFKLLKESGCQEVLIGIDSFSEKVRYDMGKRFTNDDMWYSFSMLQKYKIEHALMGFMGYPTETEEDHQISLNTLQELYDSGYLSGTVQPGWYLMHVMFNNTLILDKTSPLWNLVKDDITDMKNKFEWNYKGNTFPIRVRRLNEFNDLLNKLLNSRKDWVDTNWYSARSLERITNLANKSKQTIEITVI